MGQIMRLKILVVEDSEDLRHLLSIILESKGHLVETAGDGLEAHEKLLRHPDDFDLVISDVGIPGVDGFSLLKLVKDKNAHSKFILMSGSPLESSAHPLHADEYLLKPFRKDELLDTVSRLYH
jgi:CheY-like chemotaxis protein